MYKFLAFAVIAVGAAVAATVYKLKARDAPKIEPLRFSEKAMAEAKEAEIRG